MILDSSAVVAILTREPGAKKLAEKLAASDGAAIGAPTAFEAAMVLTIKLRRDGQAVLNDFLQESGTVVLPFTKEHESSAMQAYLQFGKSRHPAQLNFGDCMSYAVAKLAGQPLLFVGDDFSQTDIARA
jgi:ribonuclease VapC